MSTTPSRKRPAEEDAETPGFFSRLFTSAKKPRTVERSTASTPLPRIQLSPPSVKSPAATTTSRSNGSTRRLVPAQTGLLAPVHVVAKQNVTSWKPPPDGAFTIGSFAPTAARRRRVPYKPESQTLVMKRKRNKQQAKAYSELDLSRILERNKQLFFPKPNAEATASFRMPTAQRKFGSNQTGSRVPSGAAPKVSFEEQIQDKHVSFDQAQTPAASNKPRLRRTQTPGMVMHSEGTTPSPTVPQNIGGSRASGSSTATSQLSSPQTRGSGKYSSLYEPRVPQASKVASEDGPYELDGAIESDVVLGKIFSTANVDVTAPTNLPVEPLVDYAPVRFKRMPKAKPEVVQTEFMPDADEDDNSGIENDHKRVKQGEPGEKKEVLAEGWGKNMFPSKDKWKCAVCQIYNEKSKNICVSCDTPRPDADATEVADATTTAAAAPASSSSFSFGVSAPKQGEKSFSFGVSSPPSAAPNEKPKNFSFGVSSSATPAPAGVKFGVDNDEKAAATTPTGEGFGFGVAKNGSGPKTPAAKISFGVPSSEPPAKKTPTEVPVAPKTDVKAPAGGAKFNFGATPALSADAKPFPFGSSAAAAPPKDGKPFQFGSGAPAPPKDGKPFQFGAPTPKANDDGDNQNKKRRSTEEDSAPAAAPAAPAIKFGAPAADKQAAPKPSVSFGATPAKPSESKPSFVFGAGPPSTPAPPVTPGPTNGFGQSSTMHAGSTPAPPKGAGSFVFGAGGSTPAPAAPANSFGGASSGLPFAAASTPAAPAPAASAFGTPGFGATAATTPAAPAFGATPAAVGGPFGGTPAAGGGFGATPAAPAPGGGFGATPAAPAPGGFGATPAAPAPGGFGATPAAGGGFGATPAATPAPGGFGASTPGGGFGAGPAPAPSSKFNFGSTAPVSAAGSGGFGAAPAAAGSFAGAPAFGQPAAAAPFAPSAPAGGFGSGTPAPPAPGAGFGAGGGFGSGAPAPPASGFGGGSSFGAGGMSTPNTGGGGFNIGTGGTKSTGRRRIVRAKRPPGSSHR